MRYIRHVVLKRSEVSYHAITKTISAIYFRNQGSAIDIWNCANQRGAQQLGGLSSNNVVGRSINAIINGLHSCKNQIGYAVSIKIPKSPAVYSKRVAVQT